jgi:soluble lytic murein transglycosylase-like protein
VIINYLKQLRIRSLRDAAIIGAVVGVLGFFTLSSCSKKPNYISPDDVYSHIVQTVDGTGIDPDFVYALAWAESSLNENARSSVARGLMQMTKIAWTEVSDTSFSNAWDWKTSIEVGVDYLLFARNFLEKNNVLSYPLLAASYHYGPYYVQKKGFRISNLKKPRNEIYKLLFAGNYQPVVPPAID